MWKHRAEIKRGVRGEISKIQEELDELRDVHPHSRVWAIIEAADIIGATVSYTSQHHRIPSLFVIMLMYARVPYKICKRLLKRKKSVVCETQESIGS